MKKTFFAFLSAFAIVCSSFSGICANAENIYEGGTVTVRVINEETNQLFDENRNNISVIGSPLSLNANGGGAIYLDGWNTAESNPHIINDVMRDFGYSIQYTAVDYNGYSYKIDYDKSDVTFNLSDSSHKDLTIYMEKYYWGESVEYSFDELLAMSEKEFESYCEKNEIKYVSKELIESDIQNNAVCFVRMNPERFLADDANDTVVSENISDINKHNADEYDFDAMINAINLPKEYYDVEVDVNPFMIYSDSILSDDREMKSYFFKLANIKAEIKPEFKNTDKQIRLYQLMRILPEKCDDFHSISVQYSGRSDNDFLKGDVNADGNFTVADVVMLRKWLIAELDVKLVNWKAADLNGDNKLNSADLAMMKRELVNTVTESNHNIYSEKRINMIGYSDEISKLEENGKSSAVITSTEELRAYLSQITEKRVIDPMLDKYNDSFFNDNVLLVKCIFQSCGGKNMYQIDSVYYEGDSLVVNYSDNYGYESYIDVVNGLLAQVVIPKKNYHADSVEWRFTSYFDTPMLFIDDYMIIESSNGWKDEAYERVITLNGSRYSRPLCDCAFFSTYDHMNHIKSEGTKEDYINDYDVLERISRFSENAANYKDCKMKDFGFSVEDFGETKLSVLYKDENGTMQSLELYRYGSEIACLDNDDVHNLVKMLIVNGYIEGEVFWEDPIDAEKPVITMDDVLELSNKGENLTWSDFKGYKHGKNIASVDSGRYEYEFKVADYSDRFKLWVGYSDENNINYARLCCSTNFVDICKCSEEDIMLFIAKYNPPAVNENCLMIANVQEVFADGMLVTPENDKQRLIYVSLKGSSRSFKAGDRVYIEYSGEILATYPEQIIPVSVY